MTQRNEFVSASAGSPRVYLEVDAVEPVETIRAAVVGWLDDVYRQTLAPLARSLGLDWTVLVLAEPPIRQRRLRSDRVWTEALAALSSTDGKFVALEAGPIGQSILLNADLGTNWPASQLYISLSAGIITAQEWGALQERLVAHLVAAAETIGASTGFIASDEDVTSYERKARRGYAQGFTESDQWLRGVFWCTLLSQQHLNTLGGIDRVEREAPVAQTRLLQGRNGPLLLLRASDDLATFDTATLAPLYEFLAPVLPPATVFPELPPPTAPRPEPTVDIDPNADSDVAVHLAFGGRVDHADRAAVDDLLDAWYLLAVHGVFGGSVHNMDAPAYHPKGAASEYTLCTIGIDLGSAGPVALDPLIRLLLAASDELNATLLQIRVDEYAAE